ncbi:MAG: DUF4446 family protein [Firmicutes bacterium]|nr:DUF4446 family protein [Bacillota bacterium]
MNGEMFMIYALGAATVFLFVLIIILFLHIRALNRRYKAFMSTSDGFSLEKALLHLQAEFAVMRKTMQTNGQALADLQEKMQRSLQAVGFVRFNAFPHSGGELSFALALLDSEASGVVISSIYGREESRMFAKPVSGGKSPYALSSEEEEAIRRAMHFLQKKTNGSGSAKR